MTKGITVIIPAYNAGRYVKCAIQSVLAQDAFEGELKIIVINDCSSDDTADVLAEYSDESRVSVITHDTNKGVAVSRNEAIDKAETDYIAFLDADDWWSSDKLIKQY